MKVRDFIKMNADIDVYDDVCEELAIAFCGPMGLTEEGEKHFAEVLDYEMKLDLSGSLWTAVVCVDSEDDKTWRRKLRKAKEFFYDLAGYCAEEDYCKWFVSPEWGQYATDPDANMCMCVYCDTTWIDAETRLYTEDEISHDNLCDLEFPRKLVQEFYIANGGSINSFVEWIQDECTADDTDGLFAFCAERGFIAVRDR